MSSRIIENNLKSNLLNLKIISQLNSCFFQINKPRTRRQILADINFNGEVGKDQKVDFPVTFDLKAFFDAKLTQDILQRNLELILEEAGVSYEGFHFRKSGKGNFVSVSVKVRVDSESQFKLLYQKLKLLPGLKMAF